MLLHRDYPSFKPALHLLAILALLFGTLAGAFQPRPALAAPDAAPIAGDDSGAGFITDEDTPFTTDNVLTNDTDPDSDPLALQSFDTSGTLGLVSAMGFALDPAFDGDGKLTTDFSNGNDLGMAAVLQPDGKLITAGRAFNGVDDDFSAARYNTDGSLDTTFDGDGKLTTDFGSDDFGWAAALQSDGKLVIVGSTTGIMLEAFAVARYNPNGSPDPTFSGDGKLVTSLSETDAAQAVAIQPDGKIVVGGYTNNPEGDSFVVVRYNADGSLDTSFNGNGIVFTDLGNSDMGRNLLLQADGKIILTGHTNGLYETDFAAVRYNTNGSLDTSFDSDGKLTIDFGGGDYSFAAALQPDNKILIAGYTASTSVDFAIARCNPDGSLDTSFDGDGLAISDLSGDDFGNDLVLQPDGKILLVGDNNFDFLAARYNPDGSLDSQFDQDGWLSLDFNGALDSASAGLVQTDGKLILAGWATSGSAKDFAVVRYTFGTDGVFQYDPNHQFDELGSGEQAYDAFTYTITDGILTDTATVTITVIGVNDAPIAVIDNYTANAGQTLNIPAPGVLENDTDIDNDTLSASMTANPQHGSLLLNSDGSFTYTPETGYLGSDNFTYLASDGLLTDTTTVTITVIDVNDAPIAVIDNYTANAGQTLNIPAPGVLENDTDIDNDTLSASMTANPQHGSLLLNSDGSFTYTPETGYLGSDNFTYLASDGLLTDTTTVTITVIDVNDAPIAVIDNYTANAGQTLNIPAPGVLENDADIDSDILSATMDTNPQHGALALNADGSFTYTPEAGYLGSDSFTYLASDGPLTSTASVSIQVVPAEADLSLEMAPSRAGDLITYTFTLENLGVGRADGALLTHTFIASEISFTWTCQAANGALCSAPGKASEPFAGTIYLLPPGGIVTVTLTADLSLASDESSLTIVTLPAGVNDPISTNNQIAIGQPYHLMLPAVIKMP